MRFDERKHTLVGFLVCGDEKAALGVEGVTGKVADDATRRLAECDAGREVEVSAKLAVRDIRGPAAGRYPRHAEGRRDDSWSKRLP